MHHRAIAASLLVLAAGSAASAQTHYFTQGERLYSTSDNGVTVSAPVTITFNSAPVTISSLAFDPSGQLWAGTTQGGVVYRLNPATGVLTTTSVPALGGQTNTFDFRVVNGELRLLAFTTFTGGLTRFQEYNANTGAVITAATTALTGVNPGIPGSFYNAADDRYYAVDGVSYNLRSFDPDAFVAGGSIVGNTNTTWSQVGGAAFNGQAWLAMRIGSYNVAQGTQNHGTVGFRFGTVNLATGAFTQVFTVSERPFGGGFGYAVIPGPGAAALLGLGGLVAARRRR